MYMYIYKYCIYIYFLVILQKVLLQLFRTPNLLTFDFFAPPTDVTDEVFGVDSRVLAVRHLDVPGS